MKKIIIVFSFIVSSTVLSAQTDSLLNVSFGGDFMSSYIWRGQRLSSSPAIQPSMEVSIKNFTIGAWASWQLTDYWHETDIFIDFENSWIKSGITDYYVIDEFYPVAFTNFNSGESAHILEAYLGYPGSDKIPFQLLWYTNFFGDLDDDNKEQYSTYFELAWLFEIQSTDAKLRMGVSPSAGMYADELAIVEAAFCLEKEIEIHEDFSLTAQSQCVYNPYIKDVYLLFGLGCNF